MNVYKGDGSFLRNHTMSSVKEINSNFTALSIPANTPYRYSSPLNEGLTQLKVIFGSTEQSSDFMRFTIDDMEKAPTAGE